MNLDGRLLGKKELFRFIRESKLRRSSLSKKSQIVQTVCAPNCRCFICDGVLPREYRVTKICDITCCSKCAASLLLYAFLPRLCMLSEVIKAEQRVANKADKVEASCSPPRNRQEGVNTSAKPSLPVGRIHVPNDLIVSSNSSITERPDGEVSGVHFTTSASPSVQPVESSWECLNCRRTIPDDATVGNQCPLCSSMRPWMCPSCTLVNSDTTLFCSACAKGRFEHVDRRSSTLGNSTIIALGLSVDAIAAEHKQARAFAERKERLSTRLELLDLPSVEISDDGNCMFRAVSYQLVANDCFHRALRYLAVSYMRSHEDEFCNFVDGGPDGFEFYLAQISRECEWGDELCLIALSRALEVELHILTGEEKNWHLIYNRHHQLGRFHVMQLAASRRRLFLCYMGPVHYYTVKISDNVKQEVLNTRVEKLEEIETYNSGGSLSTKLSDIEALDESVNGSSYSFLPKKKRS